VAGDSVTELLSEDTKIRVAVRDAADAYFTLSPPVWLAVAKVIPPKGRVLVGDDEFDQAFLLRGRPEGFVARVFASLDLQQRIPRLRPGTGLMLVGTELWLEEPGLERDIGYLQFAFDLLCDIAERVEETAAGFSDPEVADRGPS
jgi:hypothetical protein